jgi:hypothetical protein
MQVLGAEGVFSNCTNNRMSRSNGRQRAVVSSFLLLHYIMHPVFNSFLNFSYLFCMMPKMVLSLVCPF